MDVQKKGLSPLFAVLILIAIAVIAGVVVFYATSNFLPTITPPPPVSKTYRIADDINGVIGFAGFIGTNPPTIVFMYSAWTNQGSNYFVVMPKIGERIVLYKYEFILEGYDLAKSTITLKVVK